ncbi:MAG: DinB family protein [Dehalococcoidia bacterium]
MATSPTKEALIQGFDRRIQDALRWYETYGEKSSGKVGVWGAKEVLAHCIFWHLTTAEGMEAVGRGGNPRSLNAPTDELNAQAVAQRAGKSLADLIAEARQAHLRLVLAVRALPDLEKTVLLRADGTTQTARQRLERIANHWWEHIDQLEGKHP